MYHTRSLSDPEGSASNVTVSVVEMEKTLLNFACCLFFQCSDIFSFCINKKLMQGLTFYLVKAGTVAQPVRPA
jgi:hypothetical protein